MKLLLACPKSVSKVEMMSSSKSKKGTVTQAADPLKIALNELFAYRDWSVSDAARELGIPRATIGHLASGARELTPAWAGRILATLASREDVSDKEIQEWVRSWIASSRGWSQKNAASHAKDRISPLFDQLESAIKVPRARRAKKGKRD